MINKKRKNTTAIDFLIKILAQEKKRSHEETIFEFYSSDLIVKFSQRKIVSWIAKLLPPKFKNNLFFWKVSYPKYKVTSHEKSLALDFLSYIINKKPKIPYDLFPKNDHFRLEKFLKNVVLLALFDLVDKDKIFTKEDYKRQKLYQDFVRSSLQSVDFKTLIDHFDAAVFIENYGLPYLKNKQRFKNSVIIDCGPYIGDTSFLFNQKLKPAKIIALEPHPANFNLLLKHLALNKMSNVLALNKGVSNCQKEFFMDERGGAIAYLSKRAKKGLVKVKVDTIDNIVTELKLRNISLVKMDVEGYEWETLKGAQKTIRRFKPALIVSLYHKGRDFFEIPPLLKKIVPSYQFRFAILRADSPIFERTLIAQDDH